MVTFQPFTSVEGVVRDFSEAAGLGHVESGDSLYPFHCIDIADGSRVIAAGTRVTFSVVPRLGRYEATRIEPRRP